jgi:hypothetical protein
MNRDTTIVARQFDGLKYNDFYCHKEYDIFSIRKSWIQFHMFSKLVNEDQGVEKK